MHLNEIKISLSKSLLLLSFFTILIYSNSLPNGYNMDDDYVTGDYSEVQKGIKGIPAIFSSYYIDEINNGVVLRADYRPITRATFAIEHQFFGANPYISHLINLLLYISTVVVVFKLSILFFKTKTNYFLPFLVTLFFLTHPLHTEVVDSLKNREELLSVLFGLLSIFYLLKNQNQIKLKFACCFLLFMLLSLFSKLSMAVIFMILPFVYFYLKPDLKSKFKLLLGSMFLITLVYFLFIYKITTRPVSYIENPLIDDSISIANRIATIFLISLKNIQLQIFPWRLSFYYGYNTIPISTFENPYVLISILVHIFILVVILYFFKKDKKSIVVVLVTWIAAMSMYSNALIITTGIVSERALYVATIPLAFLVGVAFQKNDKKWFLYLMFSYIAFFSIRTFVRNFDWKSNDTLMSNDLKHLNNSAVANFIYAKYLDSKYDFKTKFQERKENANLIINYYEKAIEVYPAYGLAYFRIADIKKYTLHDLKGSIKYYENAYNNDTANLDILFEVAKTNMELQQYDNAIINFKKLNFKNKSDTIALFYLAQCLDLSGNSSEALLVNQNLLKLAPNTEYPYLNLGTLHFKLGNTVQAVGFFEQAIAKGNRDNILLRQLSTYFATKGDIHKSEYYQHLIK